MWTVLSLCISAAVLSVVEGHGGLIIPFSWVDASKNGNTCDKNGFTSSFKNGCKENDPLPRFTSCPDDMPPCVECSLGDKCTKLKQWLSHPNCYYLVSIFNTVYEIDTSD